jgi:ubiquinone/menaquinone biosynthesis C-methylase UbiE
MENFDYKHKKVYSDPQLAKNYDADRFSSAGGRYVGIIEERIVLANMPAGLRNKGGSFALDMCTGTGRFAVALSGLGLNVAGCDISLPMLKEAAKKTDSNKAIRLVNGDVYNIPFKTNSFSYVNCTRLINQLQDLDSQQKAIRELCRVCQQNGLVIFDIINARSILGLMKGRYGKNLVTFSRVKEIISVIPGIRLKRIYARFVLPQSAFFVSPRMILPLLNALDIILSKVFGIFAIRAFVVVEKIGEK